jgi:hypothetical protein
MTRRHTQKERSWPRDSTLHVARERLSQARNTRVASPLPAKLKMEVVLRSGSLTTVDVPAHITSGAAGVAAVAAVVARMPKLAAVLAGDEPAEPLTFRLRLDELARPLQGSKSATTQLLVKITRRVDKRTRQVQSTTATLVGVAQTQWAFDGLSDFQLTDTRAKRPKLGIADDFEEFLERANTNEPVLVFPVQWAASDKPWEQQLAAPKQSLKRRKTASGNAVFHGAPPPPPFVANARTPAIGEAGEALLQRMTHLFATVRPVYSFDALLLDLWRETPLEKPDAHLLRRLVKRVAFTFKSGPFCRLWIRNGLDVAKEPLSRFFQLYNVRDRKPKKGAVEGAKQKAAKKDEENEEDDGEEEREETLAELEQLVAFRTARLPKYFNFQLCDMAFEPVRSLVFKSAPAAEFTREHGWFPESVMLDIRDAVAARKLLGAGQDGPLIRCPSYEALVAGKYPLL